MRFGDAVNKSSTQLRKKSKHPKKINKKSKLLPKIPNLVRPSKNLFIPRIFLGADTEQSNNRGVTRAWFFNRVLKKMIESEIHFSNENGQNSNFSKNKRELRQTKLLKHKQKRGLSSGMNWPSWRIRTQTEGGLLN